MKPRWIRSCCLKAGGGWKLTAHHGPFQSTAVDGYTSLLSLIHKRMYVTLIISDCSTQNRKNESTICVAHNQTRSIPTPTQPHMSIFCIYSFSREVQVAAEKTSCRQHLIYLFSIGHPQKCYLCICIHKRTLV